MAGWNPTMRGLSEGRLYAYQKLIQDNLGSLNDHLSAPGLYSQDGMGIIGPHMIEIGDPDTLWDDGAPMRIRVSGGNRNHGLSLQVERQYPQVFGNVGWKSMYTTYVYCYLAQDAMHNMNAFEMGQDREVVLARIEDWFTFGVFNVWNRDPAPASGGMVIPLTSTVYAPPGFKDALFECHVVNITKQVPPKGPNFSQSLDGLMCTCYGELE